MKWKKTDKILNDTQVEAELKYLADLLLEAYFEIEKQEAKKKKPTN